ncbi:MAG: ATP-binding protein [Chitinophagaceae bacterium]
MPNSSQLLRILIVEDDEDDYMLLTEYFKNLRSWQYELKWVQRYEEALKELCSNYHTLCFCDYRLGAKNGVDLIKDSVSNKSDTPIILLTGRGNYQVDIEAMKAGAIDYLIKADLDEDRVERTIRFTLQQVNNLRKVQESERRYRSIFEKSKDIVFISSIDTTITNINYAVEEILERSIIACLDMKLLDFFNDPVNAARFLELLQESGEVENFETELLKKNGELTTCLINASIELDSDNEPYVQGVIHDINDFKKAELATIQAEKLAASGRFIRTLAHEVRNPLNNIDLAVEALGSPHTEEDNGVMLGIIDRNSHRIGTLITQLLQSSNPSDMNLELLSINGIVERVIALTADRVTLRNIKLSFAGDESDPMVMGDANKLEMALLNIVINAVEAVKEQTGVIRIATLQLTGSVRISISDNGCGISKENLTRLFEPYFTSKRNGIGLGLATTLNILQSHEAAVEVSSEIDKGTVFVINFIAKDITTG